MKKILLITSLLFISCVYAQSKSFKTEKRIKSFQSEKRVQNQQELPNLILDSISIAYFSDEGGFEKYIAKFDANGNETISINLLWDETSADFLPNFLEEYTYDSDGNLTLSTHYLWDDIAADFLPNSSEEYTYDANGNQTLFESYYWNEQGLRVSNRKEQDNYDESGLLISKIYFSNSDPVSGELIPDTKWEYTTELDTNIQLHRMGIPYDYNTDVDVWEEVELESAKSYVFYTKTATLSLETVENDLISLYPNPTSELLYLSHSELNSFEIQIVDLNGKQMYSGTMKKDVPLDVSTYTSGMYLVTIENAATKKKNIYKIIKY